MASFLWYRRLLAHINRVIIMVQPTFFPLNTTIFIYTIIKICLFYKCASLFICNDFSCILLSPHVLWFCLLLLLAMDIKITLRILFSILLIISCILWRDARSRPAWNILRLITRLMWKQLIAPISMLYILCYTTLLVFSQKLMITSLILKFGILFISTKESWLLGCFNLSLFRIFRL